MICLTSLIACRLIYHSFCASLNWHEKMVCLVLLIAARKWARIGGTVYTMKNKGRRQLDPFAMLYPAQSIAALDIHLDLRAIHSC